MLCTLKTTFFVVVFNFILVVCSSVVSTLYPICVLCCAVYTKNNIFFCCFYFILVVCSRAVGNPNFLGIPFVNGNPICWESYLLGITKMLGSLKTKRNTSTTRTSTLNAAFKSIVATQGCVSNCAAPLHLVHSQQWTVQTGLKDFFAYRKS